MGRYEAAIEAATRNSPKFVPLGDAQRIQRYI